MYMITETQVTADKNRKCNP